jgi:hypothetical protein
MNYNPSDHRSSPLLTKYFIGEKTFFGSREAETNRPFKQDPRLLATLAIVFQAPKVTPLKRPKRAPIVLIPIRRGLARLGASSPRLRSSRLRSPRSLIVSPAFIVASRAPERHRLGSPASRLPLIRLYLSRRRQNLATGPKAANAGSKAISPKRPGRLKP